MAIKPLTKKRLQSEYDKNPELFWEIMTEDMIGRVPKSIQAPADDFLKTAGPKWEAWLLHQSWKIQRRAATEAKHHDSWLGMLAIIAWLLHLVVKSPIKNTRNPKYDLKKKEEAVDPINEVNEFIKGMTNIQKDVVQHKN